MEQKVKRKFRFGKNKMKRWKRLHKLANSAGPHNMGYMQYVNLRWRLDEGII